MDWLEDQWEKLAEEDPQLYEQQQEELQKDRERIKREDWQRRIQVADLLSTQTEEEMDGILDTLTEKQLREYYFTLNRLRKDVRSTYHQLKMKNLFEVSKTTLAQLVQRNQWEEVQMALTSVIGEGEQVQSYRSVWETLRTLTTAVNEDQSVIVLRAMEEDNEQGESYEVVINKPKSMDDYACELERWEDWLAYYCSESDFKKHGEALFIAHCLYEMTFCGFTQEEVQEEADELVRRIESIDIEIDR